MTPISFLVKDDFAPLSVSTQVDSLGDSSINGALTAVAQEVVELLQQVYPDQAEGNDDRTIKIRAIEPEYRQILIAEPLSQRELEVLRLIVDGYSNVEIARSLYIAEATVKTHVRHVLRKLCVNGRTQAAIRGLRSGRVMFICGV